MKRKKNKRRRGRNDEEEEEEIMKKKKLWRGRRGNGEEKKNVIFSLAISNQLLATLSVQSKQDCKISVCLKIEDERLNRAAKSPIPKDKRGKMKQGYKVILYPMIEDERWNKAARSSFTQGQKMKGRSAGKDLGSVRNNTSSASMSCLSWCLWPWWSKEPIARASAVAQSRPSPSVSFCTLLSRWLFLMVGCTFWNDQPITCWVHLPHWPADWIWDHSSPDTPICVVCSSVDVWVGIYSKTWGTTTDEA